MDYGVGFCDWCLEGWYIRCMDGSCVTGNSKDYWRWIIGRAYQKWKFVRVAERRFEICDNDGGADSLDHLTDIMAWYKTKRNTKDWFRYHHVKFSLINRKSWIDIILCMIEVLVAQSMLYHFSARLLEDRLKRDNNEKIAERYWVPAKTSKNSSRPISIRDNLPEVCNS